MINHDKPIINIKYDDPSKYLDTIYDLEKNSYINCILEVGNLWCINENNRLKHGMSIYVKSIIVY